MLAAIWEELLSIEGVRVLDNFFDLGGHSLLSMRVVARLQRDTGVRLNPGELILQTLGQVAAACEGASSPSDAEEASPTTGESGARGWARRLLGRLRRD